MKLLSSPLYVDRTFPRRGRELIDDINETLDNDVVSSKYPHALRLHQEQFCTSFKERLSNDEWTRFPRLDPFKSSDALLKSLAKPRRHWGQTRRIAVSRVDILISASAPDCSRAPVNKKKEQEEGGGKREKEKKRSRKTREKRARSSRERERKKGMKRKGIANDC